MKHEAPIEVRRRAKALYQEGLGIRAIGREIGWSHEAVRRWIKGYKPVSRPVELRRRAANLLRRGFDVPPSRQDEYRRYQVAQFSVDEIKEMMGLE